LIGFGIKDNLSYRQATEYQSGAIIGSAFITFLKNNSLDKIQNFISKLVN